MSWLKEAMQRGNSDKEKVLETKRSEQDLADSEKKRNMDISEKMSSELQVMAAEFETLAADLRGAGFDVVTSDLVTSRKWIISNKDFNPVNKLVVVLSPFELVQTEVGYINRDSVDGGRVYSVNFDRSPVEGGMVPENIPRGGVSPVRIQDVKSYLSNWVQSSIAGSGIPEEHHAIFGWTV